jgi:hypothetical protein
MRLLERCVDAPLKVGAGVREFLSLIFQHDYSLTMLALLVLADLLAAASPPPQFIYQSRTHDLVYYADGRVLYRRQERPEQILIARIDHLLSADELRTFDASPETHGFLGCKGPGLSLRHGKKSIGFCALKQIQLPTLAKLFARLEQFAPVNARPWSPAHYAVYFANIRHPPHDVEEEGVPLSWPTTLPRPAMAPMGVAVGFVLVEAKLLPEVERYAAADPAAEIRWEPALPGIDDHQ